MREGPTWRWTVAGAIGLLAALLGGPASASGAATLKADYQLQGSYSSSVAGAPELTDIGTGNVFATDTVHGVSRQVLVFPQGNGLQLVPGGLVQTQQFSVVLLFRMSDVSSYRRILDFTNGSGDSGLYAHNGKLDLFRSDIGDIEGPAPVLSNGTYAEVALTNAPAPAGHTETTAYLNGSEQASTNPQGGTFDLISGTIRFFKDDTGGGEESAGAVACIRLYDGTLSDAEVAQIAADPSFCPASAAAPGPAGGSGDTLAPDTRLKKKPRKRTHDNTPTFKFSSTEAGSTFKCRVDRKKFKPCHSPFTSKPLHAGKHVFRVEAIDAAGNVDPSPAKFKFTVLG